MDKYKYFNEWYIGSSLSKHRSARTLDSDIDSIIEKSNKEECERKLNELIQTVDGIITQNNINFIIFKISDEFIFTVRKDISDVNGAFSIYDIFKKLSEEKLRLLNALAKFKDIERNYPLMKYLSALSDDRVKKLNDVCDRFIFNPRIISYLNDTIVFNFHFGSNDIRFGVSLSEFEDDVLLLGTFVESINKIFAIKQLRNEEI